MHQKVAVVTGGSGVLGREFCHALAHNNYKVAIIGRDINKAADVANSINTNGGTAIPIAADVVNLASLNEAAVLIEQQLGSCDLLINAAGGNHPKGTSSQEYYTDDLSKADATTFFDLEMDGIDFVFKLNFMGTLLPSQVFGKQMLNKSHASIINISSMSGITPLTKIPSYSAAKAAINNFTQWLAVHFAKTNIRVNAIAPGFFLTEQNYKLLKNNDGSNTARADKIIAHTPMGRFGEAHELIGTLLWLANEEASGFVNGVVVPVDGGFSAYSGV
jgi:NAD(P)-dependent dehydrogenase (short-subunit alcohol dehydrogenase family)